MTGTQKRQIVRGRVVSSEIEDKEPITLSLFNLQYAKPRKFEPNYSLLDKSCDVAKFEELAMDKDLLCLALSEQKFHPCIQPAVKKK